MRVLFEEKTSLMASSRFRVRFSQTDAMNIVWHGNYAFYFEDAREAFGSKYGIGVNDIMSAGFSAPFVELSFNYRQSLKYGQEAEVVVFYKNTDAAKIIFEYEIRDVENGSLVATGRTVQVFLNKRMQLELTNPEFYLEWKKRNGL